MELNVDPEFKKLIPTLKKEEYDQLEKSILEEGCRDALIVWNHTIIDGHNRFEICQKHGLGYNVDSKDFTSREEAMDWIDANQIGRRNLSPDDFRMIVGRMYNRTKSKHGGTGANQYKQSGQNDTSAKRTRNTIAEQTGVSPITVYRSGKFAETVEEVEKEQPELAEQGREKIYEEAKERTKRRRPRKEVIEDKKPSYEVAMKYARMAVFDLEEIQHSHHDRDEAFDYVIEWIKNNR